MTARQNKYGARKTWRCLSCGGDPGRPVDRCPACQSESIEMFDSLAEARHYDGLWLRQRAGEIEGLQCHPRYPIVIAGEHICDVVADFAFVIPGQGIKAQDVKGGKATDTAVSRLKRKLLAATARIEIEVVKTGRRAA